MSNSITLMVMAGQTTKPRVFSISKWMIYTCLCFTAIFVFSFGYFAFNYLYHNALVDENLSLIHENNDMKNEIQSLVKRLEGSQVGLNKVNQFYQKLLKWSNINQSTDNNLKGIGPVSDEEYALSLQSQEQNSGNIIPVAINKDNLLFKNVFEMIDHIDRVSALQLINMQSLMKSLVDQQGILETKPSIKPTNGWVTSLYGTRVSPFTNRKMFHSGIDIAAAIGTPIIAPAKGIVVHSGKKGSYGNIVKIDHGNGIVSLFAHVHEKFVRIGQKVNRGDRIAAVGNTGRSTGPHLHYELTVNGIPANPYNYILND